MLPATGRFPAPTTILADRRVDVVGHNSSTANVTMSPSNPSVPSSSSSLATPLTFLVGSGYANKFLMGVIVVIYQSNFPSRSLAMEGGVTRRSRPRFSRLRPGLSNRPGRLEFVFGLKLNGLKIP